MILYCTYPTMDSNSKMNSIRNIVGRKHSFPPLYYSHIIVGYIFFNDSIIKSFTVTHAIRFIDSFTARSLNLSSSCFPNLSKIDSGDGVVTGLDLDILYPNNDLRRQKKSWGSLTLIQYILLDTFYRVPGH